MRPGLANGRADCVSLMAAQVIDDDDIAGLQDGNQCLFDIGTELDPVDRAVEQDRGVDPVMTQRGQEGECAPFAAGSLSDEALASLRPAARAGHVGLGPSLVDKDQTTWIKTVLMALPAITPTRHVRPVLLGGVQRFF